MASASSARADAPMADPFRVLDLVHESIVILDLEGRILVWNSASERLYGWSREEAVGKDAITLMGADSAAQQTFDATGYWAGEVTRRRSDGTLQTVDLRRTLRRDAAGAPLHIVESGRELTEKNAEIERMHAELSHAARVSLMGELTASIAHELNQPLTAILGAGWASLRWLDRAEPNLEEARASISDLIDDTRRASSVIARVRSMVTKERPERAPVSINEIVEDAAQFLRRESQLRRLPIVLDLAPSTPRALADRIQIQQVVVNLGINAMQAMSDGGGSVVIRTRSEGDVLRVRVEDSGAGITPESAGRLFQSFFTTKHEGMGMGLRICRSIIEAHEGSIDAENHPEGGAVFAFTLPALPC